jgi:hypothetical protein
VNYAGQLYRDPNAPAWDEWIQKGYISAPQVQEARAASDSGAIADVRESVAPDRHTVPVALRDPYHQPHLQNFFDAVRGKAKLNCPSEVAYETAGLPIPYPNPYIIAVYGVTPLCFRYDIADELRILL